MNPHRSHRACSSVADVDAVVAALAHTMSDMNEATALAEPPLLGREEARYDQEQLAFEGGLSQVNIVVDRCLGRTIAQKRLRPSVRGAILSREVRLLARLQHPNIVPLYDLTYDACGQPDGYTMPLLRGFTLRDLATQFHRKRPDATNLRAALAPLLNPFRDVCRAIAHAHGRGIWHLDLKGTNVQVDESGAPMVLDWNLARTENDETGLGGASGTPGYLAPEQARGEAVGPLTDVYGLGALLYELLTGQAPFADGDPATRIRNAGSQQPIEPRRIWPRLPGALNAICVKALSGAPQQRYASPEEMRADVERWQNDEPVKAWQEPWWQRLARWSRRHRGIAATALTLTLAALPLLVIWMVQMNRAQRETNAALGEARDSYAVVLRAGDKYFTTMSGNRLLQGDGLQTVRKELLNEGLQFYQEFLNRHGDTPELRQAIARGWVRMAELQAQTKSRADGAAAAERAVALLDAERKSLQNDDELLLSLAQALRFRAEAAQDRGDPKSALEYLDTAASHFAAMSPAARKSEDGRRLKGQELVTRSHCVDLLRMPGGLDFLTEARVCFEAIARDYPTEGNQYSLATILVNEAMAHGNALRHARCRELMLQADDVYQKILASPDVPAMIRLGGSGVAHQLGRLATQEKNYAQARRYLTQAYELRRALAERNPSSNHFLTHQASTAIAWIRLARENGTADEHAEWLLRSSDLLLQCITQESPNSHMWPAAITTHVQAGRWLLAHRRYAEAAKALHQALDIMDRLARHLERVAVYKNYQPVKIALELAQAELWNGHATAGCAAFGRATQYHKAISAAAPSAPKPPDNTPANPEPATRPPATPASGSPASKPLPPPERQ